MGDALRGRRVAVTGAARGLGASAARALAREGAACLLLDRLEDDLREVTADLGPPARSLVCDLGDRPSCHEAAALAKEVAAGDLAALVHCAGVLHLAPIGGTSDAAWDETLAVNLTAAFLFVRALLPELAAGRGGSILLTSSRAGILGFPRESAYCASKFGTEGLVRALAEECRGQGVSVNSITPGGRRIKPTGLSPSEEAALPERERPWGSSAALGIAFAAFALLDGGPPTGGRFEADRVADTVQRHGLPLPPDAWRDLTP